MNIIAKFVHVDIDKRDADVEDGDAVDVLYDDAQAVHAHRDQGQGHPWAAGVLLDTQ